MRRAVAETSIAAYYSRVIPHLAASQNERVMAAVKPGRDYSLCELMTLTVGIDKSSMSRVVNGLRAAGRLEPAPQRECTITHVRIIPSRLPVRQRSLFDDGAAA